MAEVSSPAEYFTQRIPQQFATALADAPDMLATQPELTAVYEISGVEAGIYNLRTTPTSLDVRPGSLNVADFYTTLSLEDWQKGFANSDAFDPFVDYVRRGKIGVIKTLKGTVRLELERSDGVIWQSMTMFNGHAEPELTLAMAADDYAAMMRGDLDGQMAFLSGKLKFEGSLPLLMQIGALSS